MLEIFQENFLRLNVVFKFSFLALSFLSSCGYHSGFAEHNVSISVPYIEGDRYGYFTNELIRQINESTSFNYSNHEGDVFLKVAIIEVAHHQIGYRRDLIEVQGSLQDNIRPTEERKNMKVQVTLESPSNEIVWGPYILDADVDYDYVDQDSLQDLAFTDPTTKSLITVLSFSLGQLESIESAQEAAAMVVYRRISQKIVEAISATWK